MTDTSHPPVADPDNDRCGLCSRVLDEVEGKIEALLRVIGGGDPVLLDVGCWDGEFSNRCGSVIGASRILGVEIYEPPAQAAESRGLEVARVELETGRLPWPDASVDVVVCNQVLEHLKNIWLPMSEMHRVLRPGGHAVFSVPNLASLHNRVLLALGRQPTSIRVFGPHVRGYTWREFRLLVEREGAYSIKATRGAGFYPVPSPWSAPLSALWKGASHTMVFLVRKETDGAVWTRYLDGAVSGGMQTFYAEAPDPDPRQLDLT
jgi:SAM-dependent methyltransferase